MVNLYATSGSTGSIRLVLCAGSTRCASPCAGLHIRRAPAKNARVVSAFPGFSSHAPKRKQRMGNLLRAKRHRVARENGRKMPREEELSARKHLRGRAAWLENPVFAETPGLSRHRRPTPTCSLKRRLQPALVAAVVAGTTAGLASRVGGVGRTGGRARLRRGRSRAAGTTAMCLGRRTGLVGDAPGNRRA